MLQALHGSGIFWVYDKNFYHAMDIYSHNPAHILIPIDWTVSLVAWGWKTEWFWNNEMSQSIRPLRIFHQSWTLDELKSRAPPSRAWQASRGPACSSNCWKIILKNHLQTCAIEHCLKRCKLSSLVCWSQSRHWWRDGGQSCGKNKGKTCHVCKSFLEEYMLN